MKSISVKICQNFQGEIPSKEKKHLQKSLFLDLLKNLELQKTSLVLNFEVLKKCKEIKQNMKVFEAVISSWDGEGGLKIVKILTFFFHNFCKNLNF